MVEHGPKMAADGPKMAQDGPRWPQDGAKTPQDGAKMVQDGAPDVQNYSSRCPVDAGQAPNNLKKPLGFLRKRHISKRKQTQTSDIFFVSLQASKILSLQASKPPKLDPRPPKLLQSVSRRCQSGSKYY